MAKALQASLNKFGSFRMISLLVFFHFLLSCSTPDITYLGYTGTYTNRGSKGIYSFRFNPATGDINSIKLAAISENPSFIAIDSKGLFLYAVNEVDTFNGMPTGAISIFQINRSSGKLNQLEKISSMGQAPAHLSLDKSGKFLFVANYNSGNFSVFPIRDDGSLGKSTAFIQSSGTGLNPERQAGPHAHFIQATSNNKFVLVADLGIDRILIYKFDPVTGGLTPNNPAFVALDPGAGPRHFAFAPSGNFMYVLNELSSTVSVFGFDPDSAKLQIKQTTSTLPDHFTGRNTAAEILSDKKGRFLYVSNRGDDSIVIFSIDKDDGSLTAVDRMPCGGKTPRNIEIDPTGQWMLAANQDSDDIKLFRIDQESGRLIKTTRSISVNSPVCVRFIDSN